MKRLGPHISARLRARLKPKDGPADKLGIILQALQAISIIAGGIYFLIQYHENIVSMRKQETMKFAEKFLDRSLTGSDTDFDFPFQSPDIKPRLDKALSEGLSKGDICPIKTFYETDFIGERFKTPKEKFDFYSKLSQRIRAFETIAACVNTKGCDLDTACGFFFAESQALLTNYCVEFDRYRVQFGESPAKETEKFLRACSDSPGFSSSVKSLTYCESVRHKMASMLKMNGQPEKIQLAAEYKNCPF